MAYFKPKRNLLMDALKGYAIFLVVLGHVIQTFDPQWKTNPLELGIYMFHMPLFIFISGYFFYHSLEKYSTLALIKRNFVHLMLPSLSAGTIWAVVIGGGKLLKHSSIDIIYLIDLLTTGLWFLTTLFVLTVIGTIIYRLDKKHFFVLWVAFYILVYLLPDFWICNNIEFLLPFFVIGIICRHINWEKMPLPFFAMWLAIYIICLHFYDFHCTMYEMSDDTLTLVYMAKTMYRIVCGMSGIIVSMYVIKMVMALPLTTIKKAICKLGMMTLPIYALHQHFFVPNKLIGLHTNNLCFFFLITLVVLILCIIAYRILRKSKVLALLLFGEKYNHEEN